MSDESTEPQLAAFRRLLKEAAAGGQAKVDALLVLMQRTVFVVPWPTGVDGYRTLVNSDGVAALPVFTDRTELAAAAARWGWLPPDAGDFGIEIGARQALHYARAQSLAFIVLDIAAEHGLEIQRDEFEPLLTAAARRESSGPFAGTGRISSTLMRAVRPSRHTPPPGSVRAPTPPPGSIPAVRRESATGSSPGAIPAPRVEMLATAVTDPSLEPPVREREPERAREEPVAATGKAVVLPSAKLGPPMGPPREELLDALEAVLREYPEVEWGCLGMTEHGRTLGLRVHEALRTRLPEIAARVSGAAGATLPVALLDSAADVKIARASAFAFYPWRRK